MAANLSLTATDMADAGADARRLEECSLNAAGSFQSLVYDGWLLGYRRGPTKRLRCVNPFYASSLPIEEKIAYCTQFYEEAGLPAIFRLSPWSRPSALDAVLELHGWNSFDRTAVMRVAMHAIAQPGLPASDAQILPVSDWTERTASLLNVDAAAAAESAERTKRYPLPQAGAIVCRDGSVVACGLLKMEGDHAGLYALVTAKSLRGQGLGRVIVAALLREASRHGARGAYLQVTAANASARSLYRHFGFADAYDYWYRTRSGEDR